MLAAHQVCATFCVWVVVYTIAPLTMLQYYNGEMVVSLHGGTQGVPETFIQPGTRQDWKHVSVEISASEMVKK